MKFISIDIYILLFIWMYIGGVPCSVPLIFNIFLCLFISASRATAHISRVYSEALCHIPRPKIIPVTAEPSKSYIPHCTILHRCSDDTGCCHTDAQTCVAKKTNSVELYFYVSFLLFMNFYYFFLFFFVSGIYNVLYFSIIHILFLEFIISAKNIFSNG